MIRKIISCILIAVHVMMLEPVHDALASRAVSESFALTTDALTGSNRARIQTYANTKLLLHADGTNGSISFSDTLGKAVLNNESYASSVKLMLHANGADGSISFPDSAASKTVTANGQVQMDSAQSKFGGASALFDGSGDYLTAPDSDDWNLGSGDFTMDFQVRFNALPSQGSWGVQTVIGQRTDYLNYWNLNLQEVSGSYRWDFVAYNGGSEVVVAFRPTTISTNTWYHISIVRQGNILRIFQDGVQVGADAGVVGSMPDVSGFLYIGCRADMVQCVNGWIDELRIVKGAATWGGDFTPFPFEYGRTVIQTGQSKFGGASAAFDGTGNYLEVADSDDWNFGAGDFTIDGWYYFASLTTQPILFSQYADAADHMYGQVLSDGAVYFNSTAGSAVKAAYRSVSGVVAAGAWTHIAVARSGTSLYLFVNGSSVAWTAETPISGNDLGNMAAPLRIGQAAGLNYLNGWIDEFRVSKGAAKWTSNFTPPTAPYTYDFDDFVYIPTLKDSTGEACSSKSQSASYIVKSGYVATLISNPPQQTQTIPNQSWDENTSQNDALDLDNYFVSPDGLSLTYSVLGNQNIDVSIDPVSHLVSFTQAAGWTGTENIQFKALDSNGDDVLSNQIALQVSAAENPPVLDYIPDMNVSEGGLVTIVPHATDADGDDITYSFTAPLSAQGTWQTGYNDAGLYTITLTATDTTNRSDTQQVHINIGNVNRPPVLNAFSDITAVEGDLVVVSPQATDPDGDAISLYYSAPLDTNGRWLTGYSDSGTHAATVTASDGIDTVNQNVNIIINNVNRSPEASLTVTPYTSVPNTSLTITLVSSDPDGDVMTYVVKKDDVSIASGTYTSTVNLTVSFDTIGDHTISATVTDSPGLSVTRTKGIDITDPATNQNAINPVMGDFNGDCLMDLGLHNSDTGLWEVCLSAAGDFTNAMDWLTGFGLTTSWQPTGGDFNGDGKTDVGIYNSTTGEFRPALSNGSGFAAQSAWLTFPGASASWQIFTGNFNADKYTDLAFYNKDSGEVRAVLGTGSGFGAASTWLSSSDTAYTAMSGDFNGDGLGDLCLFKKSSGEFKIYLSNSSAFTDGSVWLTGYGVSYDAILSDFNHDGLTDIGYWDKAAGRVWNYAISTGAAFVSKGVWLENFGATEDESATTGDFNGDGVTDRALFKRDAQGINRWNVQLNSQKPCDLLIEINNGTGGKTQVTYSYASQSDNDLPFPVYVAFAVSLVDSLPAEQPVETYTQNLSYSGGYFDFTDREFRGFAKVKVTDPVTNNYAETYFYQGAAGQDGALKGQIEKIKSYDGNGLQISETLNTYEVRKAGPENNVLGFPSLKETQTTVWEENATSVTTESTIAYDNIGNVTEAKDEGDLSVTGDEKSTVTTYATAYTSGFNRPLSVVLKDQNDNAVSQKTFEYDSRGNLTREEVVVVNPLTSTQSLIPVTYAYDSFGNLITTTDALNHAVTTEYETTFYTFPSKVTNALGQFITYVYDPKFGIVTSVTDTNGNTSSTSYDSFGRIIEARNADNAVTTTYAYPDFNTKTMTNAASLTKTEYVDGLGRKYKSVSSGEDGAAARTVSTEVFFNDRGLVDKESVAHYVDEDPEQIAYVRHEYDLRGRPKKVISDFPGTLADAESTISYINPLYTETIDPQGHRKGSLKDVYGNVKEVTEFVSGGVHHTAYTYDIQGNLTQTTDSKGNVTQIWYDSIGRKLKMSDPDMGLWLYEYDLVGNLLKQTDAKGQEIEFEYDVLNRLTGKVTMSPSHQVISETTYIYDEAAKENCTGRLSKVTDASGQTEFFYDNMGREIKSVKTVGSTPYTVERTYDVLDRLLTLKYPDNEVVAYSYDAHSGLLEHVQGASNYVNDISYNAKGQIKTIAYSNGTSTNYTYGQDLRLARILTTGPSATLQDLNYIFDKNGNITTLTDNLRSNIRTYAYDDLDRLVQAQNVPVAGGGYGTFNYQYDSIGNMTYKSDVGVMTYGANAGPHAVTSAGGYSYVYDANGNMVTGKNKTLEYDVENRIIKVIQPDATTDFTYDGDGGRVKKVTTSPSSQVITDTTCIGSLFEIHKTEDSGQTTEKTLKHIYAGSAKVCSIELTQSPLTSRLSYYHPDHLGSSSIVTDENGVQVSRYEYTPYGSIALTEGTDSTACKFTGKELDRTGLYFYGARYYDPELGRFVTPDTIVQAPYDPQSLNRYAYCRNNPLNYVDPSGHWWWFIGLIIKFAAAHPIITAAIGGAILNTAINASNIHNFANFMTFAAIGAVSAAAGAGTGIAIGATSPFWGMVAGSFVGGFLGGAGNAGAQGASFGQALAFGLQAGVIAAATAAVVYGASKVIEKVITAVENASKVRAEAVGAKAPSGIEKNASSKALNVGEGQQSVADQALFDVALKDTTSPEIGEKVYRVFGDGSKWDGQSWTPENPNLIANYRAQAGLPNANSGRFVAEARITNVDGIVVREARVIYGNGDVKMIREYVIQKPSKQIELIRVSGVNPEF